MRPLRRVHALAVLGGESGGFGVKYHDLHFVDCLCDCIAYAIDYVHHCSNQFFVETSTEFRAVIC